VTVGSTVAGRYVQHTRLSGKNGCVAHVVQRHLPTLPTMAAARPAAGWRRPVTATGREPVPLEAGHFRPQHQIPRLGWGRLSLLRAQIHRVEEHRLVDRDQFGLAPPPLSLSFNP
jgi:hypothetical protein